MADNDYPLDLAACDVNINLEPALDEDSAKKLFVQLGADCRVKWDCFKTPKFKADEKTWRLNNGDEKESAEGLLLKMTEGASLGVAWGRRTPLKTACEICGVAAAALKKLPAVIISSFNAQFHFEISHGKTNAYERIAALAYASPFNDFIRQMKTQPQGDSFKLADNDFHNLFYIGNTQIGVIKLIGRTSRTEILSNEFEGRALRLLFGIQESEIEEDFSSQVEKHVKYVHMQMQEAFVPCIVKKFVAEIPAAE